MFVDVIVVDATYVFLSKHQVFSFLFSIFFSAPPTPAHPPLYILSFAIFSLFRLPAARLSIADEQTMQRRIKITGNFVSKMNSCFGTNMYIVASVYSRRRFCYFISTMAAICIIYRRRREKKTQNAKRNKMISKLHIHRKRCAKEGDGIAQHEQKRKGRKRNQEIC